MSFILDALKKSESDRQRQSGPSLFEVKVAPPRRTLPVWAVAIAVLLGIYVIVVSWMLLRRPAAPPPATASIPAAATAPATASGAAVAPGARAPRTTASVAAATTKPATSGPDALPANGTAAPLARHADHSGPPPPDVVAPNNDAPAAEPASAPGSEESTTDGLPLYQQIVTSAGLPTLHLDLHVFARRPQDRFVMINLHRLREGDSLPNGVQVDAIRPDGVALSYHGTRFLLPRN